MDLPDFRGKTCLIGRPLYSVRMELDMDVPPTLDGKRGAIVRLLLCFDGSPDSSVGRALVM